MRRINIVCVEGLSASSKKEEKTLSSVVSRINCAAFNLYEFKSSWWLFRKRKIKKLLKKFSNIDPLLFIGKSQGAVNLINTIDTWKKHLCEDNSYLITIDPHNAGKKKSLYSPSTICRHYNIFQCNKWPKGQNVIGAFNFQNNLYTHTNIIYSDEVNTCLGVFLKRVLEKGE